MPPKPRLFILIFDIFDYSDAVGDALDYFFEHVYREHDGILLLSENRLLEIGENKDPMVVRSDLKQTLKNYTVVSVQNIHKAYLDIQEECDKAIRITLTPPRLKAGVYFLTIETVDRITGEKDVFSRMIEL